MSETTINLGVTHNAWYENKTNDDYSKLWHNVYAEYTVTLTYDDISALVGENITDIDIEAVPDVVEGTPDYETTVYINNVEIIEVLCQLRDSTNILIRYSILKQDGHVKNLGLYPILNNADVVFTHDTPAAQAAMGVPDQVLYQDVTQTQNVFISSDRIRVLHDGQSPDHGGSGWMQDPVAYKHVLFQGSTEIDSEVTDNLSYPKFSGLVVDDIYTLKGYRIRRTGEYVEDYSFNFKMLDTVGLSNPTSFNVVYDGEDLTTSFVSPTTRLDGSVPSYALAYDLHIAEGRNPEFVPAPANLDQSGVASGTVIVDALGSISQDTWYSVKVRVWASAKTDYLGNAYTPASGYVYRDIQTIDVYPPGTPENLEATSNVGTSVTFNWSAAAGEPTASYNYYIDGQLVGNVSGSPLSVMTTPTDQFYLGVTAVDASGNESHPAIIHVTPTLVATPPTPTNFTGNALWSYIPGTVQVYLSWDETDYEWHKCYRIYKDGVLLHPMGEDGMYEGLWPRYKELDGFDIHATEYIDRNVYYGSSYTYNLVAVDVSGNESVVASSVVNTSPSRVSQWDDLAFGHELKGAHILFWHHNYNNNHVAGYYIYQDSNLVAGRFVPSPYNINGETVDDCWLRMAVPATGAHDYQIVEVRNDMTEGTYSSVISLGDTCRIRPNTISNPRVSIEDDYVRYEWDLDTLVLDLISGQKFDIDINSVIVVKNIDHIPEHLFDGVRVMDELGSSFVDTYGDWISGKYYYAVFVEDVYGNYSDPYVFSYNYRDVVSDSDTISCENQGNAVVLTIDPPYSDSPRYADKTLHSSTRYTSASVIFGPGVFGVYDDDIVPDLDPVNEGYFYSYRDESGSNHEAKLVKPYSPAPVLSQVDINAVVDNNRILLQFNTTSAENVVYKIYKNDGLLTTVSAPVSSSAVVFDTDVVEGEIYEYYIVMSSEFEDGNAGTSEAVGYSSDFFRLEPAIPTETVVSGTVGNVITWNIGNIASDSTLLGRIPRFYVFKKLSSIGFYPKAPLNSSPITASRYVDKYVGGGPYDYMIRAV